MRKGFTMIELLVVVGILAVLMGVLITGFWSAPEKAEIAKCQALVNQTATALTALFDQNGVWPEALRANNNTAAGLDERAAYPLASQGKMTLSSNANSKSLTGLDKLGIVTPWAAAVIKKKGNAVSVSDRVPMDGKTIADHRLRYALDLDNDGKIEGISVATTIEGAKEGAGTVNVRATAAVWCRGPKGKVIRSWHEGQTQNVN